MPPTELLLSVRDLVSSFQTDHGPIRAVDGVSFDVPKGARVSLVGESGCGKSVTSLSILRLLPHPEGRIEAGEILFRGTDLVKLSEKAMRSFRGRKISMVFQEPMTSLNPVYTVGSQIKEILKLHHGLSRANAQSRAIELLDLVGIASPDVRINAYPHQLSGGMRQRIMIAMALACEPELLIADEPTTALDVTIQAQILDLLRKLCGASAMSTLLITHDLGVVAEFAEHIIVMYAGQVVERGTVDEVFRQPMHPYTEGLLNSIPPFATSAIDAPLKPERLRAIPGSPPDLARIGDGCRFASRCSYSQDRCRSTSPPLSILAGGRASRCFFASSLPPRTEGRDEHG